jgi:hypothetical protein
MAIEGLGIAVIPVAIVENEIADGRLEWLNTDLKLEPLTFTAGSPARTSLRSNLPPNSPAGSHMQACRLTPSPHRAIEQSFFVEHDRFGGPVPTLSGSCSRAPVVRGKTAA